MGLTTDPNDHRLGHGSEDKPGPQNEVYLVLSEEERTKGFVRPVRHSYKHVGIRPTGKTRPLTDEESEGFTGANYALYEEYGPERHPAMGRYWTKAQLESGCGSVTTMGQALAETYARDPRFYHSTFCCTCQMHRPVEEFVWEGTEERVGS